MLKCDGYIMFHGTVKVIPCNGKAPFDLTGTWLYKPAWSFGRDATEGCWYCKKDDGVFAESYPPDVLDDFRDDVQDDVT